MGQQVRASQVISTGLRAAWRNRVLVSLFFACNLLLAAAVAAPMHSAIADHVGRSMVGNELARGFSAPWLVDFQFAYAHFLKGFSVAIVYGSLLFLLLNSVLAAGAFEVFSVTGRVRAASPEAAGLRSLRWTMHGFGRGIGRYWGRFLRLTAIGSLLYFVLFRALASQAGRLNLWLFRNGVRQAPHFYLEWLRWALLFFGCFVVSAMLDYARAALAADPERSTLAALGEGAGFVLGRLGSVLAIYFGIGILSAMAVLTYAVFARFFPQSSAITVLVWFLVAQGLFWVRWLFRLSSWSAAVVYYAENAAASNRSAVAAVEVS
jgi:hypothetical protein